MYDNGQRSLWAEQVAGKLIDTFPAIASVPKNILVTVSYPYSCSRGAIEKVQPASFDTQWQGNDNENGGMLAIHPIAWIDSFSATKAMLYGMARSVKGPRHGASSVGLRKNADATLTANPETEAKIQAILAEVGDAPAGFGKPFETRKVNRGRMVKYSCACSKGIVYRTNNTLDATCNQCNSKFQEV